MGFVQGIAHFLIANFDQHIYVFVFILIFIEEAGVPLPIPGDVCILLAGSAVYHHRADPIGIVLEVVIASALGSSLLFWLVSAKGEPLVEKYGKYILVTPDKLEKGKRWFTNYGGWVIIVGRWIPGLRIVLTLVAGIFRLNYIKFVSAIAVSSAVWASAYLYVGEIVGKQNSRVVALFDYLHAYTGYAFDLVIGLIVVLLVYAFFKSYKRKTSSL